MTDEESKSDERCERQTRVAALESVSLSLSDLVWLRLKEDQAFDENLISKSTAGTGCMHPTGRLLAFLPAYRSLRGT